MIFRSVILSLSLVLLLSFCTSERPEMPNPELRKSPIAVTSIQHADTYVKIVYGQPYKNNRTIFGDLVPYGEVWRTGANEATELTTTRPIRINGKLLEEGTYALFTIPEEESWTIIFNKELGQWGAFEYSQDRDVMRVEVPSRETAQTMEIFTIQFDEIVDDSTNIIMAWDQTEVRIPLTFVSASGEG